MPLMPQAGMAPGGLPPGLLQALGQGGMPPGGPQESQEPTDPLAHLRMAIEHAQAAQVSMRDDAVSSRLTKLVAGLYAIFESFQKDEEAAKGLTPALRHMQRQRLGA